MVLQRLANAAAFLGNDPSVLDMNDPVREWQQTRIMRYNQHGVSPFPGYLGKQLHDRLAIGPIKRRELIAYLRALTLSSLYLEAITST